MVWRPTGSTRCLRCEGVAAFKECEIQIGGRWVRARVVAWPRRWEAEVEYVVHRNGRSVRVRALVDWCSPDLRRVES